MKTIERIVPVIVLAALLPLAQAADSSTPAPTKPAKQPPRAPTLVSVVVGEDDPDFAAGAAPEAPPATAAAALDPAMTSRIQSAPLAQRDAVIAEIESRMNAAQQALVALRDRVGSPAPGNANTVVLQRASMQARTTEQALRKNLQKARESKTAPTWAAARTALARNYGDYAKAVADMEAAGRSPVALTK